MNVEQNIYYAKEKIVDLIDTAGKNEGRLSTFRSTKEIFENRIVENKSIEDVEYIMGMTEAWEYLFNHIHDEIDLETVKALNQKAGKYDAEALKPGYIIDNDDDRVIVIDKRFGMYVPPIPPSHIMIDDQIKNILSNPDKKAAAAELYMYLAKGQFFDGANKRTAALAANMFLIQNGKGLFVQLTDEKLENEFISKLFDHYNSSQSADPIRNFIIEHCIIDDHQMTLGEQLQTIREKNDYSRERLAEVLMTTPQTIYNIEKNREKPTKSYIDRFTNYFYIDKNMLGRENNDPPRSNNRGKAPER